MDKLNLLSEKEVTLKTVITFGTFDVFHSGHVNILRRSREMGDRLVVGISSDQLNFSKKGRNPVYPLRSRMNILHAIRYVDQVFVEESLDLKREYIIEHQADILVMGDDWKGKFEEFKDICEVKYLPRTPSISTTEIIEVIKDIE
ncbi:MAG: glycerol-3-phosphate cytidylyltransferase [Glaciecola sp.]